MERKYRILGKYVRNNEVYAYKLEDTNGNKYKAVMEIMVLLVEKNQVEGCIVDSYNGKRRIRGYGINLEDIPICNEQGGIQVNIKGKK